MKFYFSLCFMCFVPAITCKDGSFWQITDIHIDLAYSTTGDIKNGCLGKNKANHPLGLYGDFSCDSNMILLQDSVDAMKKIHPNPDFILWTGDNVPHFKDKDIDWNLIFSSINQTTSVITDAFPHTLVIPVLGNHDVHPYKHFPWSAFDDYNEKYLTIGGWGNLIPVDQTENWKKGAYYSLQVNSQLTILVVNTFLYEFPEKDFDDDPKQQFSWLTDQLENAQNKNIKVIVTSHIPPGYQAYGNPFLVSPYVDKYLAIINKFSHVILAQIYAHLHRDTFRLFHDTNGEIKSHAFLGPSVTPWKYPETAKVGNNPCVRLYNYSLESDQLLDYQQYCLNFTLANKMAAEGKWPPGQWDEIYKATELFNVPDLNLNSAIKIYEQLKSNNTIFDAYLKNYMSGFDIKCDSHCRKWLLCAIQVVSQQEINKFCGGIYYKNV